MKPLGFALVLASTIAWASTASAAPRFAPPTHFTVTDDAADLVGSALSAKWDPPAEPPPAGYRLAGYRIRTTHHGPAFKQPEFVHDNIEDAADLLPIEKLKKGNERTIEGLDPRRKYTVTLQAVYTPVGVKLRASEDEPSEPAADVPAELSEPAEVTGAQPIGRYYDPKNTAVLIGVLLYGIIVALTWVYARRRDFYIRPIPGMRAVDDAIGRATEMGQPLLYISGLGGLGSIATIAAMLILGHLARRTAAYGTPILVPCNDSLVMSAEREIVREAYLEAGRPEAFRPDDIFYLTDSQFGYTSAVGGIIVRERPAANFFMGFFAAESLIIAETGNMVGSVQIAGTDSDTQLPFFIASCDYTLLGEELYAAGAYLSRHPLLMAQLKGQDMGKTVLAALLVVGVAFATWAAVAAFHVPPHVHAHASVLFDAFMKFLTGR